MVYHKGFVRTSRVGTWVALSRENVVRLIDLEDLLWELQASLSDYKIAYCSSGGPLALYCGGRFASNEGENFIYLFNAKGAPHPVTPRISLGGIESVLFMCFNECNDDLIVVLNTGKIEFFNMKGEPLVSAINDSYVPTLCVRTGNGVAFLVNDPIPSVVLLECGEDGEYRLQSLNLPQVFQNQQPNVMLVIPQQFSETGYTEVFIPFLFNEKMTSFYHCVFYANPRCYDLRLSIEGGNVVHVALSSSAQYVAFLVLDGTIYLASRSFEDIVRLINIDNNVIPAQFLWCGDKCIAYLHLSQQFDESLGFSTKLTLVNAEDPEQSDFLNDIPAVPFLVSECDGIRILSSCSCQFLQVVSGPSRRIFSLGSQAASAMLLTAFDEFMCGDTTSVKMIRDLQKDSCSFCDAVDDCIAAAGFEFDVFQQKRLMRVAAFGKSFCPLYESDTFVKMARRLRVLNTLRKSVTGMLISQAQLSTLEGNRLSRRLLHMNQYQLAYHICDVLGFSTGAITREWALAKLTAQFSSEFQEKRLVMDVIKKLKQLNHTDFAELAYKVYLKQKPHTALLLLEAEEIVARKIKCFLDIKQPKVALKKALVSGDCDLIFLSMMHLIKHCGTDALSLLISDTAAENFFFFYATSCESQREILEHYFRTHPKQKLYVDLLRYLKEEQRLNHMFNDNQKDVNMLQQKKVTAIQNIVILGNRESSTSFPFSGNGLVRGALSQTVALGAFPVSTFQQDENWLRLHMQLVNEQEKLIKEFKDDRFFGASVKKTITLCYEHECNSVAERIKSMFNVSDKMHSWSMLNAYAATSRWELIDQLGCVKNKNKPVIGGAAFITTLLACGRREQAKLFIHKLPRIEERMEYYIICGDWEGAGADCRRSGEPDLLAQLKERVKGNSEVMERIEKGWCLAQESGTAAKFTKFFFS